MTFSFQFIELFFYEIRSTNQKHLFLVHYSSKKIILFKTHTTTATILGIVSILGVWQLGANLIDSTSIFPSPLQSLITLTHLAKSADFWIHISITLFRGILGGILSLIIGFLLGLLSSSNKVIKSFILPWIILLRSIPVISVILLAIVWLMPGYVPFFIMLITVTPVIAEEVTEGIIVINQDYREMISIYKIPWYKQLKDVILPGLLPRLASGFSLGMGYGWRAVVVGEVLSRPQWGIGDRMAHSQNYFNTDELIAWTVILISISYFFDKLISYTKDRIIKWQ